MTALPLIAHVPAKAAVPDPVAMAARDIELAAADLLHAVAEATTVDEALRLWKLASTVEAELTVVTRAALDRAEAICSTH